MSLFFWLFSIVIALPIIGYAALYFYSYSKTVLLIEDNGEASFFYTLLFFITVVIVGFLSFAVYYLIKTHKRRKMVFDILMERAREYYPDFDTNPETKERVLRIISERTRWKDWPVDRFQIIMRSCDLFANDAAKYKATNSI